MNDPSSVPASDTLEELSEEKLDDKIEEKSKAPQLKVNEKTKCKIKSLKRDLG